MEPTPSSMQRIGIDHKSRPQAGIYLILCIHTSGRDKDNRAYCYVGRSVNMGQRHWQHRSELVHRTHKNTNLQWVWDTFGEENMVMYCLEEVSDNNLLPARERYWINKLDPQCNIA